MKNIIALNGIMGVGKSTIGKKLADKIDYYFIDSDCEIEDRAGKTISQIFKDGGEDDFRQIEKNLIFELISRNENIVLALGGGSYINDEIRQELSKKSVTIWLKADIDVIFNRLKNKNNRPLLNCGDKRKILLDLINKRNPQ